MSDSYLQEEQLEKATDAVMHNFCLFRSPRTPGGATELERWEVKHIMRVALEAAFAAPVKCSDEKCDSETETERAVREAYARVDDILDAAKSAMKEIDNNKRFGADRAYGILRKACNFVEDQHVRDALDNQVKKYYKGI